MTDEMALEAANRAAQEHVRGACQRALDLMDAVHSGARIAGNVVFWPDREGAA